MHSPANDMYISGGVHVCLAVPVGHTGVCKPKRLASLSRHRYSTQPLLWSCAVFVMSDLWPGSSKWCRNATRSVQSCIWIEWPLRLSSEGGVREGGGDMRAST